MLALSLLVFCAGMIDACAAVQAGSAHVSCWILLCTVHHLSEISGTNLWDKQPGRIFGTNLWDESLGQIFRTNLWSKSLGRISGANIWDKSLGQIDGTNIWSKSLGQKKRNPQPRPSSGSKTDLTFRSPGWGGLGGGRSLTRLMTLEAIRRV